MRGIWCDGVCGGQCVGYGVMVCVVGVCEVGVIVCVVGVCEVWCDSVCEVWCDSVCVVGHVCMFFFLPTEYRKNLKRQWMVQLTSFLSNRFVSHSVAIYMYCLHFPLSECIHVSVLGM